jgi:hypothetical protein
MAPLIGFTIGLTLRFFVWAARVAGRTVRSHPFACLVAVLFAASQDWIGETVALWALIGLTVWALLSVASTRFPASQPQAGQRPSTARVAVGNGPWRTVELRDAEHYLTARERRRFEKARHRHDIELARKAMPPR